MVEVVYCIVCVYVCKLQLNVQLTVCTWVFCTSAVCVCLCLCSSIYLWVWGSDECCIS